MKPSLALRRFLLASTLLAGANSAHAASWVWNGGGATNIWTDADNWVSGTPSTGNGSVTDIYTFTSVSGKDTSSIGSDSGFTSTDGRFLNQLIYDSGTDTALSLRLATTTTTARQLNFKANGATNPSITIQAGATGSVDINGGGGSGSVWIDANLTIDHNGDGTLSITRPINGASGAGITKTGKGQLIFTDTNTNTGGTILNQGTISLSTAGRLGATTGTLQVNNTNTGAGTAVQLTLATSANTTVGSLSGTIATPSGGTNTANITTGSTGGARTFTVNQTAAGTYAGTISGAGNFALGASSNNKLTLTGDNSYTGTTSINAGTLEVSGNGDINQSSGIIIASGAHFKYNSSVALGTTITNNGGTISGEGDIGVSVTLNSLNDILAPGNSPGIQEYTVGQTWNSFTYQWEINDWIGSVGANYDQIQITGDLTLSGGAGAYEIDVLSLTGLNAPGAVPNFAEGDFSWTILTTSGTLDGFNAANWAVDTSGFSNAFLGDFTLTQAGNNIVLNYAVPEPGAALLGGLGFLLLLRRRR